MNRYEVCIQGNLHRFGGLAPIIFLSSAKCSEEESRRSQTKSNPLTPFIIDILGAIAIQPSKLFRDWRTDLVCRTGTPCSYTIVIPYHTNIFDKAFVQKIFSLTDVLETTRPLEQDGRFFVSFSWTRKCNRFWRPWMTEAEHLWSRSHVR